MTTISRAVLVTGCSTGIGRATAELLAARRWTVYASARRLESIADLEAKGCRLVALDVTDDASRIAAVEHVVAREGAVGVLVNNAGINELGALESVPLDRVRALFETNLFGMIELCRLTLPGMRAQRWGRIVTVGSMNGRFAFPGMSAYSASKHALEAISDAVRFEARPFGVGVSLIEPGMVRTPLARSAVGRRAVPAGDDAYAAYDAEVAASAEGWESGPMARFSTGPEGVAKAIARAVEASGLPRARYRVAASAHILLTARRLLPDAAFDALLRTIVPSPEPPRR